jgi:ABC-type polysaccharide/polyol phosphate export permease
MRTYRKVAYIVCNFFIFKRLIKEKYSAEKSVSEFFSASLPWFFIGYWILHEAGFLSGLFFILFEDAFDSGF